MSQRPDDRDDTRDDDYSSIVDVDRRDDIASICGHVDSADTFAVIINAPRGNRDLSTELGARRLMRHAEESGKMVAIATRNRALASRARQMHIPVARRPERVRWDAPGRHVVGVFGANMALPPIGRFVQLTVILAVVAVVVVLALTMAPSATVTAYPPTETLSKTIALTATENLDKPDYAKLSVPASQVATTTHLTIPVTVTGKAPVGTETATTTVNIHNTGSAAVTVPKGAIIEAIGNRITFAVDAETAVPAAGTAQAHVTAMQPGTSGNVAAGALSHWLDDSFSTLDVANPTAAGGGADAERPAVAGADLDNARQQARTLESSASIKRLITADHPHDAVFLETAAATATVGDLPAVGTPTDVMLVDVEVHITALAVLESTLNALAEQQLVPQAGHGQFIPGSVGASEAAPANVSGGVVTALLNLHGDFARNVSASAIRDAVKGKSKDDVQSTLATRYGIQNVDVGLTPNWAPWLPRFGFRIDVHLRGATPTATATPEGNSTNGPSPTAVPSTTATPNPGG